MAYAILSIYKVKSNGNLVAKCNHNCRKVQIDNVIPELSDMNDELIPLPKDENGNEMEYNQAVKQRLKETGKYRSSKIRKDAVKAYEVLMTFSKDDGVDVDTWEKQSIEWLKKTFDVAPDSKSNIIHAVCHKDEPGNVHIHAMVVPIDEKGSLNATRWTDGSRALSKLQTAYADSVANLGLERGIRNTSDKHKNIRRFYGEIEKKMEIPEAEEGETAADYRLRVMEILKQQRAMELAELYRKTQKAREKMDKERIAQYEAIKKEAQDQRLVTQVEVRQLKEEVEKLSQRKSEIESETKTLLTNREEELNALIAKRDKTAKIIREDNHIVNDAEKYRIIEKGLSIIQNRDPEKAEEVMEVLDYIDQVYEEDIETPDPQL